MSAVKITTPTIEMTKLNVPEPRKMLITDAAISPMRPMNRMPPMPASERLVTAP